MFSKRLVLSLVLFSILMVFASMIKNKSRSIEKKVEKLEKEISILKKDKNDAQIDFIYLSNPQKLQNEINSLTNKKYLSFENSRIFLSINHFKKYESKQSKKVIKKD